MESFKSFIQSISKGIHDSKLSSTVEFYESMILEFEKVTSFQEAISKITPSMSADLSPMHRFNPTYSHLSDLLSMSLEALDKYFAFFEKLEQLFSAEQYAKIWIVNPRGIIPDPVEIFHWICESRKISVHTK